MDNSVSSVASPTEFPRFSRLPAEVRIKIWELCVPCRVIELHTPIQPRRGDPLTGEKSNCNLVSATRIIHSPPLLDQVCYESRDVALKHGFEMDKLYQSDEVKEARFQDWPERANAWVQPGRDILHLHWSNQPSASLAPSIMSTTARESTPNQLLEFTLLVQKIQLRGFQISPPSIMTDFLFDGRYFHGEIRGWRRPAWDNQPLARLPAYRVVITTINFHLPLQVARQSGLFGLVGDAPIQLVDTSDLATIVAFYKLFRGREEMKDERLDPASYAFREMIDIIRPRPARKNARNRRPLPPDTKVTYGLGESFLRKVVDWKHFLEHRYILSVMETESRDVAGILEDLEDGPYNWRKYLRLVLGCFGSPEFRQSYRFKPDNPLYIQTGTRCQIFGLRSCFGSAPTSAIRVRGELVAFGADLRVLGGADEDGLSR